MQTSATPPSTTASKPHIDFAFISSCEGGQRLKAYVPDPEHSESGVTLATGFDLGCRDIAALRS